VTQCFVLSPTDEVARFSRLALCAATCVVMKKCFHLLGINPLERI
jgi:arginyl-tRNA synthetase